MAKSDEVPAESNGHAKILSLDDIMAASDLEEKTIDIEEWGGSMKIRALSRGEVKSAYRRGTDSKTGDIDADAIESMLVCWASVDPKLTPPDFTKLAKKNAAPVAKLIDAILGLSGVDAGALARAKSNFRD
jgi:hypothetical protein